MNNRVETELEMDGDQKAERRPRLREIPILPSMLTLGNLFCGFLSIAYATDAMSRLVQNDRLGAIDRMHHAALVVFLAMIFDALDGRVARLTGQASKFGGELDSLADMVTFGLAPALMTKILVEDFYGLEKPRVALAFSAVYVLCAALRLARYNAEADAEEGGAQWFQGLPSPGAACLVAGIVLVYTQFHEDWEWLDVLVGGLAFLVPILGLLMFSRIPYPHMMNRVFHGPKPVKYLALLGCVGVVIILFRSVPVALALSLLVYVLSGPVLLVSRLVSGRAARSDLEIFD